MKTRITELLGIQHPIFQAAMSWASSNAPLVIAVSNAGGMGILAAGPMRTHDFAACLDEIRAKTKLILAKNVPNGDQNCDPHYRSNDRRIGATMKNDLKMKIVVVVMTKPSIIIY